MAILHLPRLQDGGITKVTVRPQRICSGWYSKFWVLLYLTHEEEAELSLPVGYAVHRLTTESAYIYQLREISTDNSYRYRVGGIERSRKWTYMSLELGIEENLDMPEAKGNIADKISQLHLIIHLDKGGKYFVDSLSTTLDLFSSRKYEAMNLRERLAVHLNYKPNNLVCVKKPVVALSHGWNRFRQIYCGTPIPSHKVSARKIKIARRVGGWFSKRDFLRVGGQQTVVLKLDTDTWQLGRHHNWYSEFHLDVAETPWSGNQKLDEIREYVDLTDYVYTDMTWIDMQPKLLCHLSHARWRFFALLPAFGVYPRRVYGDNISKMYYSIGIRISHENLLDKPVKFPGMEEDLQGRVDGSYKMGMALSHAINELKYQISLREDPLYVGMGKLVLPKGHMIGSMGNSGRTCPWTIEFTTTASQPVHWRMREQLEIMLRTLDRGGEGQLLEVRKDVKPVAKRVHRKRRLDL